MREMSRENQKDHGSPNRSTNQAWAIEKLQPRSVGVSNAMNVEEIIFDETAKSGNPSKAETQEIQIDYVETANAGANASALLSEKTVTYNYGNISVGKIPKIEIEIANGNLVHYKSFIAMIDSGANVSCIDQSTFDKLKSNINLIKIERKRPNPSAANSTIIKCIGEVKFDIIFITGEVRLKIRNVRFSIFPKLSHCIILGMDIFKTFNLEILREGNHAVKLGGYMFSTISNRPEIRCIHQQLDLGEHNLTLTQVNIPKGYLMPSLCPKSSHAFKITGANYGTLDFCDACVFIFLQAS